MLKAIIDELWVRWQTMKFGIGLIFAVALLVAPFWIAIHQMKISRIENYPHASALIIRTWTNTIHAEDKVYFVPMGHLQFVRTNGGKTFNCAIDLKIPESYTAGESIDIVPRADSCFEPIVPEIM